MIFLSYSRSDGVSFVADLEKRLQAHQKPTWRDIRDLHSDQDFTGDIEEAIENSSHIVVCITPDTKRKNSFVRREIQYALALQKPVIPCRCADIPPHVSIVNSEWIDYFANPDVAFRRLLTIIDDEVYENRPSDESEDPFRDYLEAALKSIVEGLRQRIIVPIDLRVEGASGMIHKPERKRSIFEQAFSGVRIGAQAENRNFTTFREGFEAYDGRVLLLGEPGAGKTVTLMAHARDAFAARLDDPTQPLPLFNLATLWDAEKQPPLHEWIAETHGLNPVDVRREMAAGRALLLLDGLDELGNERENRDAGESDIERYDPRLRFLQALPANNRILMTSRIKEYREIGEKAALNGAIILQPLDDQQMRSYLRDQQELLLLLENDEQLRELTRTPLLMSLFAFAYRDLPDDERHQLTALTDARDLRDKIFMRYIDQRYEHERAKIGADLPFTLAELKDFLGRLAMENAAKQFSENVLGKADLERAIPMAQIPMFTSFAVHLNLMLHGDDESLRFIHLLLRDTLAFCHSVTILSDPLAHSRYTATEALEHIADSRAIEPLISALSDPDDLIRSNAAAALGNTQDIRSVEPLIHALKDDNLTVRRRAAAALAMIGAVATDSLIQILSDANPDVRSTAAITLGKIGDPRAVDALGLALEDDDPDVRINVAHAFVKIGRPAVSNLSRALVNSHVDVRRLAALALVEIRDPEAVPALMQALRDEDVNVRYSAAVALGNTRDTHAIPALMRALQDTEKDKRGRRVCDAAASALEAIDTPNARDTVKLWRKKKKKR